MYTVGCAPSFSNFKNGQKIPSQPWHLGRLPSREALVMTPALSTAPKQKKQKKTRHVDTQTNRYYPKPHQGRNLQMYKYLGSITSVVLAQVGDYK